MKKYYLSLAVLFKKAMESRVATAVEKKRTCNCAQAVVCSYGDVTGLSEAQSMALAAPLGLGMGNMKGTCGALTGAALVLGSQFPDKGIAMKKMARILQKFQQRNGAIQCCQLKGVDTGVVLRDCYDCVADACEFLEQELDVR